MTETAAPQPPATRLWTPDGFRDDEWRHADSADALASNRPVILPLHVFLDLDPTARHAARDRLGVLLQPADKVESIADLLDDVGLVALAFPAFNDGRSFSKGEILRSRYGFDKPIRAVGQVLIDQLPHMLRLGFDQFEVSHPVLLRRLESGDSGGLSLHYQPTSTSSRDVPAGGSTYSWRRKAATTDDQGE